MADLVARLAARSQGDAPSLRPRPAVRFGPPASPALAEDRAVGGQWSEPAGASGPGGAPQGRDVSGSVPARPVGTRRAATLAGSAAPEAGLPAVARQAALLVPVTGVTGRADPGRLAPSGAERADPAGSGRVPLAGTGRSGAADADRAARLSLAEVIDALDAGRLVPRAARRAGHTGTGAGSPGLPDSVSAASGAGLRAAAGPRPVQVTIGQIVVRADPPAAPLAPAGLPVPQAAEPGLSLRDYLRGSREPR